MVQLGCCCILNLGSHIVCQRMIASQTTYKATVQDGTVRLLLYLQPWFTYSPLENKSYQLARPHIKQRCRMVQLGCCCILYLGSHIVCQRMIASQTTYKATVQDGTVRLLLHHLGSHIVCWGTSQTTCLSVCSPLILYPHMKVQVLYITIYYIQVNIS